ncbi:hypothetical protein K0M31_006917 [Melipona bicolor]|uniref:Uncharacterized protein n=1 Tax=Melipona bicolor TaxID=60889 RepID=A0AA40FS43_9HYME|nr:hypothetical protein K0M31_006917 [Melipona bicolor]
MEEDRWKERETTSNSPGAGAFTGRIVRDGNWKCGFKVGPDVTYGQHVVISEMATSAGVRCFLV